MTARCPWSLTAGACRPGRLAGAPLSAAAAACPVALLGDLAGAARTRRRPSPCARPARWCAPGRAPARRRWPARPCGQCVPCGSPARWDALAA
ncbi:hypothetical protein DZC73_06630 [Albitalea terrae]|uniref:Uncharacterized protein n=1 Tax=Piscinibacter terrae TaxID=2496871 RepID=A0A3N7HWG2_9BURK|nr:hypothetical protein DZC73_06630 [Albitalea terrae]